MRKLKTTVFDPEYVAAHGDPLQHEIDLTRFKRVPNPFMAHLRPGQRLATINGDLMDAYPSSQRVNAALRGAMNALAQAPPPPAEDGPAPPDMIIEGGPGQRAFAATLDADVAAVFKTTREVNDALRRLVGALPKAVRPALPPRKKRPAQRRSAAQR